MKFIGIAPEESSEAVAFIKEMKDSVDISLAHTNADYDTAMAAFAARGKPCSTSVQCHASLYPPGAGRDRCGGGQ